MGVSDKDKGSLDETLKNLNLSNEEVDKFTKAFKDPEFIKLFEEYAREVSDPKVKEENDLYLRQLESEGRAEEVYGKGVQLIVPTESFVLKTRVVGVHPPASAQPKQQQEARDQMLRRKAFVNVCTSDKVAKFSLRSGVGENGRKGTYVEMPLSLGPQKQGTDKKGEPCLVWDFVVHPETVEAARSNPNILRVLADTAFENVEKAHGFKLAPDFKRLAMSYKGTPEVPKPHVLSIRTNDTAPKPGEPGEAVAGRVRPNPNAPAVPGLVPEAAAAGAAGSTGQAASTSSSAASSSRSGFKFPAARSSSGSSKAQETKPQEPHQPGYKHEGGEVTPQWELVHRGELDLAAAWGDAGRGLALPATSHPQSLVLRVQLPGVTSAGGVELDVSRSRVGLKVPGRYLLDTALPFPVKDEEGRAKFDKAKQQLEVVLPTVPPPPPPRNPHPAAMVQEVVKDQGEAEGAQGSTQDAEAAPAHGEPQQAAEQAEGQAQAGRQQDGAGQQEAQESSTAATTELTENMRKWAELHAKQQEQQQQQQQDGQQGAGVAGAEAASSSSAGEGAAEEGQDFQACSSFSGARAGFYFSKGPKGLGYYRDRPASRSTQKASGGSGSGAPANDAASRALAALASAGIAGPAGGAAAVAAAAASQAVPQLKPRLHRELAEDLD